MSTTTPYFSQNGTRSWNPSPSDNEVTSLQKINGQLQQIVANGSGGSGPQNSLQLVDAITSQVWTLTVQNGILTLS